MQTEAFKITGLTAVVAAIGFLSRWLQNIQLYDETGLPTAGLGISAWLIVLILLTAGALVGAVLHLRRFKAPDTVEESMAHHSFLFSVVGFLAAATLLISGGMMLLKAGEFLYPALRRVLGLVTIGAAFCAGETTLGKGKPQREGLHAFCTVVLTLFACFWLVVIYKENSGEPATWSFAAEIMAGCAAIGAFYYLAGYRLSKPQPYVTIYFCQLAMFLCAMCIIDNHSTADSVAYAGVALLFGLWGFILTENLEKPEKTLKYKL